MQNTFYAAENINTVTWARCTCKGTRRKNLNGQCWKDTEQAGGLRAAALFVRTELMQALWTRGTARCRLRRGKRRKEEEKKNTKPPFGFLNLIWCNFYT